MHHAHELAVHGWVAPCVRRDMGRDESALASRGRTHAKTSIHLSLCAYTNYSAKKRVICVHHAHELAVQWMGCALRAPGRARGGAARKRDAAHARQAISLTSISSTSIRRFHDSVADDERFDDSSTSTVTVKCSNSRIRRILNLTRRSGEARVTKVLFFLGAVGE